MQKGGGPDGKLTSIVIRAPRIEVIPVCLESGERGEGIRGYDSGGCLSQFWASRQGQECQGDNGNTRDQEDKADLELIYAYIMLLLTAALSYSGQRFR